MGKFGFSFSWRRALGISAAKGRLSRQLGVPLTRSGRQRKAGRQLGCVVLLAILLGSGLITSVALAGIVQHTSAEPSPATPLPTVTLPPELDRVLRDYERAWRAHDAQALSDLFVEDGFVLANGHPPVRGRTFIRSAYSEAGGALSLRPLAYATANNIGYIIGGFSASSGVPDTGKFVLTLKRSVAGRWLIMSDMDNPNQQRPWQPPHSDAVPPPPSPAAPR